jgi:hypothetical protein
MRNHFYWLMFFFLLTSCGYHWKNGSTSPKYTVSIPYIDRDLYGVLNSELAYHISSLRSFSYVYEGGQLDLLVKIVEDDTDQIGYRRDRRDSGDAKKNVVPTEGRLRMVADVWLRKAHCQEVLLGPMRMEVVSDFDYVDQDSLKDLSFIDNYGKRRSVLAFSCGQLESKTSAQDGAYLCLYRKMAQKIVDVISLAW